MSQVSNINAILRMLKIGVFITKAGFYTAKILANFDKKNKIFSSNFVEHQTFLSKNIWQSYFPKKCHIYGKSSPAKDKFELII